MTTNTNSTASPTFEGNREGADAIIARLRANSQGLNADTTPITPITEDQRAKWKAEYERDEVEREAIRSKARAAYDGRYDARCQELYNVSDRELTAEELMVFYHYGRANAYTDHFIYRQLYKNRAINTLPVQLWFGS